MKRGFTLVETLVVVAILGLLAAISIPLTLNSINRAKQGKTIADMRAIATAWESRAAEVKSYNAAGATFTMPATAVTATDLNRILAPTYIRVLPRTDGWGFALDFATEQPLGSTKMSSAYSIRSMGRDGKLQSKNKKSYTIGRTRKFDCDIVYSNGAFMAYPEGVQK